MMMIVLVVLGQDADSIPDVIHVSTVRLRRGIAPAILSYKLLSLSNNFLPLSTQVFFLSHRTTKKVLTLEP
jgi:hypothetical protein